MVKPVVPVNHGVSSLRFRLLLLVAPTCAPTVGLMLRAALQLPVQSALGRCLRHASQAVEHVLRQAREPPLNLRPVKLDDPGLESLVRVPGQ